MSSDERIDELQAEVERLRLTDAERAAVAYFAAIDGPQFLPAANDAATTLRVLLERTNEQQTKLPVTFQVATEHAGSAAAQPSAASAGYPDFTSRRMT